MSDSKKGGRRGSLDSSIGPEIRLGSYIIQWVAESIGRSADERENNSFLEDINMVREEAPS